MQQKLKEIFNDLVILINESENDYDNKEYSAYEDYIKEHNNLLLACKSLGLFNELKPINEVPNGHKGSYGFVGTQAEIAKHKEVITTSKKLLSRIRQHIKVEPVKTNAVEIIELLCKRFHIVSRQLRSRYSGRVTLDINDEYDVQDLFHSLLKIYFDDLRPEEHTPSYAGSSKRMDFLLKDEEIVIEIKKTRSGLGEKEVGEQLLIDINTYSVHPNCKTLVCFVYDPEGRIGNPIGLEKDIEQRSSKNLNIRVYIYPK